MKSFTTPRSSNKFVLRLFAALLLASPFANSSGAETIAGANDDFSGATKAVVALLQTRDTAAFAAVLTPSSEDWKSILSTNLPATRVDPLKDFQAAPKRGQQQLEASARDLLAKADALHLDFSKGDLHARAVGPRAPGRTRYPSLQAENEYLGSAEKMEITFAPEGMTNGAGGGEFKIALRSMLKFPGGWRCNGGVQWAAFPPGVADPKTTRELALLAKVAAYQGFTDEDDPALLTLGEALVRFLRSRDVAVYEKDALMNSDLMWAQLQKAGRKGPSRKEFDDQINAQVRDEVEAVRGVLKTMEDAGIELKEAEIRIKQAVLGRAQRHSASSLLDGLMGEQYKLTMTVKTDRKAKSGTPLSGEYILAANRLERIGDEWRIMKDLRWNQLPAGVVDEKIVAAMKFEDYVAEHMSMPPGTPAPEIDFITLDGEKRMKLSDLRGKVVVLDFWATWCGPCQDPMAKLQTLRQEHPDWKDKVAIVPLSIDDTIGVIRSHVNKRGWTNTFNVWAGDGGWMANPAKSFRVTGVPTTYIIDAKGVILKGGHPAGMPIGADVDSLLAGVADPAPVQH